MHDNMSPIDYVRQLFPDAHIAPANPKKLDNGRYSVQLGLDRFIAEFVADKVRLCALSGSVYGESNAYTTNQPPGRLRNKLAPWLLAHRQAQQAWRDAKAKEELDQQRRHAAEEVAWKLLNPLEGPRPAHGFHGVVRIEAQVRANDQLGLRIETRHLSVADAHKLLGAVAEGVPHKPAFLPKEPPPAPEMEEQGIDMVPVVSRTGEDHITPPKRRGWQVISHVRGVRFEPAYGDSPDWAEKRAKKDWQEDSHYGDRRTSKVLSLVYARQAGEVHQRQPGRIWHLYEVWDGKRWHRKPEEIRKVMGWEQPKERTTK